MDDTAVADDYSGPFDPNWTLERLSRAGLARLCREYMLVSMLHDRSLMPHVAGLGGMDASVAQADDEWMGSSPIYTARNKVNLGIVGDGAAEVLKSFQFDVGMPHHFLDFRGEVIDDDLGYFWLPYCGAHDYVRFISANDEGIVRMMCHQMEDNTFDATLKVTNPRARCIPIHRPPRPNEFAGEHCRWEVRIVAEEAEGREDNPTLATIAATRAASFEFALGESREAGGLTDYSGEFRPDLRLEDFAHPVLVRQAKEFALDVHLLMRAAYVSVERRHGSDALASIAPQHLAAIAPPLIARLRDALGIDGAGIDAVAKMLQVTPIYPGDYTRFHVEITDGRTARVAFDDCVGLSDRDTPSPLALLTNREAPGFEHFAQAVNPQAGVRPTDADELVWEVEIDPGIDPVEPHPFADLVGGHNYVTADMGMRAVPVALGRRP
jgi:hypothetical protein